MIETKEITWGDEGLSPFRGDMSDFDWKNVSEVRVGYNDDSFEWIKFIRIVNGYRVLHAKTSKGVVETCPEDIWGIRLYARASEDTRKIRGSMDHRFREAGWDYLEFYATVNSEGVPTIPKHQNKLVDRICKRFQLSIKDVTGNFEKTTYHLNQELDEEQASEIETWVKNLTRAKRKVQ